MGVIMYTKKGLLKSICIVCVILFSLLELFSPILVYAKEPIVIVIDPGHGGENLGTTYLPIAEKYYNMTVAMYMKERLEEYEDVIVYLTHTEDIDMSLQERAEFADSVDADFLFSLHFNQSISHNIYGAEVWIPSEGTLYSQGYGMANEFMKEFDEMGLFHRGIKTRLGKKGDDYYGIIRNCALFDIPALIIEHCHVDHPNDISYMECLQEFGYRNADAVARYFALSTKDGSVDNSEYAPLAVPTPNGRVSQDYTAPVFAKAELVVSDRFRQYATIHVTALEQETYIQHYAYSLDDGLTWSTYYPWTKTVNSMTIRVNTAFCNTNRIIFKVSNQYDMEVITNAVTIY